MKGKTLLCLQLSEQKPEFPELFSEVLIFSPRPSLYRTQICSPLHTGREGTALKTWAAIFIYLFSRNKNKNLPVNSRSQWNKKEGYGSSTNQSGNVGSVWWDPPDLTQSECGQCEDGCSSSSLAPVCLKAIKLCFCRYPVLLPLFPAQISNFFCLLQLREMVCTLFLVQCAQCIHFLPVLPANHSDFVNVTYTPSLRNTVRLKFETEICSKGTKSLKNFNWEPFMIEETLLWYPKHRITQPKYQLRTRQWDEQPVGEISHCSSSPITHLWMPALYFSATIMGID